MVSWIQDTIQKDLGPNSESSSPDVVDSSRARSRMELPASQLEAPKMCPYVRTTDHRPLVRLHRPFLFYDSRKSRRIVVIKEVNQVIAESCQGEVMDRCYVVVLQCRIFTG
jgi:hypothetical protein